MTSFMNIQKTFCVSYCVFPESTFFRLIQKWQAKLDSGIYVGTTLIDMSKPYDCLSHDLLIAKLETYGLDVDRLNFLLDYFSLRTKEI